MITCDKKIVRNFGGDCDSWQEAWVFNRPLSESEIADFIDYNDITSHYGGPGRGFARKPIIRQTARKTVISQMGGLDI